MPKKLYFYDDEGQLSNPEGETSFVVSEIRLPAPSRLKRILGKCSNDFSTNGRDFVIGKTYDIAFGDPVVLRGCKFLGRNVRRVPSKIKEALGFFYQHAPFKILCFEYKGARVWLASDFTCLLEKLLKS